MDSHVNLVAKSLNSYDDNMHSVQKLHGKDNTKFSDKYLKFISDGVEYSPKQIGTV